MNRERREALGIPIHDDERDHLFVDGYCSCGEQDPTREERGLRTRPVASGTGSLWSPPDRVERNKTNLDRIEGNREEYFG